MNLRLPLLTAAFALAVPALTTPALAQTPTTLDDFNGTSIDANRWFVHPGPVTVSNSRAHFAVTGANKVEKEIGLHSYSGFTGDFEFVLDFDNLSARNRGWGGGILLGVYSAEDLIGSGDTNIAVELAGGLNATGSPWRVFGTWRDDANGSKKQLLNAAPNVSAGQLRLTRKGSSVTAAVRPKGQTGWTTFKAWSSPLSDLVSLEVFVWNGDDSTNNSGVFSVSVDKITYSGRRLDGPQLYGKRCHDLIAFRNDFPYLGSKHFGILCEGDSTLANAPLVLVLGFQRANVPLALAGAPGCYLLTDMVLQLGMPAMNKDALGFAPLPVPNDSKLLGVSFTAQMAALKAGINNLGYAFSNGVAVKIFKR